MDKRKDSFFTQLRRLADKIERESEQYRQALTGNNEEFCAAHALKIISDLKNDIKLSEKQLLSEHERQKKEREKLDDVSATTNGFLDNHLSKKFSDLEQYLAQYGYKPYEVVHGSKAVTTEKMVTKQEESMDSPEDCAVPKTPPAAKPPQDPNRTPRLEDAGISLDTLQYLNSLQKHKPPINKPVGQKPNWSNIPHAFQHNGIICTPSLTKSLNADISYCPDLHSALASPVLLSTEEPSASTEISIPVSPELCTPGIKQILSNTHYKHAHDSSRAHDSNKRPVNVGLFKSDEMNKGVKTLRQEPKVPDLTSQYDAGEPVEPELTYSLEALSDMTGVYRINPTIKPTAFCKPLVTGHDSNKENATPPEPEMLTNRISRVKIQEDTQPVNDFQPKETISDDIPPSPKLLGNYDFLKH